MQSERHVTGTPTWRCLFNIEIEEITYANAILAARHHCVRLVVGADRRV
jgi:hypothetical protein